MKHIAQALANQGRGPDDQLVHMSSGELAALNHLGQKAGLGSLTTNPRTGLPEAGLLSSLLPMLGAVVGNTLLPGIGGEVLGGALGGAAGAGASGGNMVQGALGGGVMGGIGGAASNVASGGWGNILGGTPATAPANITAAAAQPAAAQAAGQAPSGLGTLPQGVLAAPAQASSNALEASMTSATPQIAQAAQSSAPAAAGVTAPTAVTTAPSQGMINSIKANYAALSPTQQAAVMGSGALGAAGIAHGLLNQRTTAAPAVTTQQVAPGNLRVAPGGGGGAVYQVGSPVSATNGVLNGGNYAGLVGTTPVSYAQAYQNSTGNQLSNPSNSQLMPAATYSAGGKTNSGGISALPPHYLKGPGDGMSDNIPAHIDGEGQRPDESIRVANNEYIVPADAVSHLGNGSSDAGAKVLDKMVSGIRKARTGSTKQAKKINPSSYLPA